MAEKENGKKLKIGIMGGTFNPIHIGHLITAENAYETFGLDKIVFLPNRIPPHKDAPDIATEHRVRMLELAIGENPHFALSRFELEKKGVSYTFETLTELQAAHPDHEYYFILGADSLFAFDTWREPETICSLCTILAATRHHMRTKEMEEQIAYLAKRYHGRILLMDNPTLDISSEEIRERVGEGKSVRYFVPESVERYILSHHLYQTEERSVSHVRKDRQ